MSLLSIHNLSISFPSDEGYKKVIHQLSIEVETNEILGIVGESGSGKSVSSHAIMGLLGTNAQVEGEILFEGCSLLKLSENEFRKLRGNAISMIFQEPMSSLNPSMKCGEQVIEIILQHQKNTYKEAYQQVISLFEEVKLPRPKSIFSSYPHEVSGGQKQRVMIAMALANKPKLLIADEPTTALDVSVQKEILHLIKKLQQERQMSVIFISHDLDVVAQLADRVLVMYQGKKIEENTVKEVFNSPQETYTKALLSSKPRAGNRLKKLPTVADFMSNRTDFELVSDEERKQRHKVLYAKQPLLEIKKLKKTYTIKDGFWSKPTYFNAVDEVSFSLYEGETLGLVGESGCGKSTLSNLILGLDKATSGEVFYQGKDITKLTLNEFRKLRKDIQLIFQDPFASLNPRLSIGNAIMEPMLVHKIYASKKEAKQKTLTLLKRVGLDEVHFNRYPHEFSGGQRQRVGIARSIALQPKFIICDESVSALDISVQAQVLNLLNELKEDFGFSYLFISHDLNVVRYMSDQLLVMKEGKIVERGEADTVFFSPKHDYTKSLIESSKLK